MDVRILYEPDIRSLIGPAEALQVVRDAFVRLAGGEVTLPPVIGLDIPEHEGEVHVKGAYLQGTPFYTFKEAAGFYGNPAKGLPVGSGLILVFDAATGMPRAVLFDNGYLTELRTGAAGALAADLLAKERVSRVGIVGSGVQARYQLEALLAVRQPDRVVVFGRTRGRAHAFAEEAQARHGVRVTPVGSPREAVEGSDVVITVTPARQPLLKAEWLSPGMHITAMGSDSPEKQELEPAVLSAADKVVADVLDQCLGQGEIHHAVEAGAIRADDVYGELAELAAGRKPGRTSDQEITVADLTGVGIQDAAVANFIAAAAFERGLGHTLEVPLSSG